jgi:fructose-bisphosphate aldolase, class I
VAAASGIACEAKSGGLAAIIWPYPCGGNLSGETPLDICAYAAQLAAQLGGHIIKIFRARNDCTAK